MSKDNEEKVNKILNELGKLNVDFSSLEFGTIKDLDLLKNKCPCCGLSMFLLEDGKWTHLFSEAFRAAHKRDVGKRCINKIFEKNLKKMVEKNDDIIDKFELLFRTYDIPNKMLTKNAQKLKTQLRTLVIELNKTLNTDNESD